MILFIITSVIILALLYNRREIPAKPACKLHTWKYTDDHTDMYCNTCGFKVGELLQEEGE